MPVENNNLPVRRYEKEYKGILDAVFGVRQAFAGATAPIQILDGVKENDEAFSVKVNNTPVTMGTYDTDANTAFGTGTANSSRFGERTEIIYENKSVPYDYNLSIHEGIDRFTVNNDFQQAIADRLRLHAEAQTRSVNARIGKFLSDNAGHTVDATGKSVQALFNELNAYYTNNEVVVPVTAYVKSELYHAIIDDPKVTTAKASGVSIDDNNLAKYKDISLVVVPDKYFDEGVSAIVVPNGVVIPFIGISTTRTVESEDFDGVALQAAARGGTYVLEDNKKAIIKVTSEVGEVDPEIGG